MIRKLNPKRIIYMIHLILSALFPMRPYALCRQTTRCPCPAAKAETKAGLAIGDSVSMHL